MEIIAKPKLDLVFKKIFTDTENTDLLVDFISSVTGISKEDMLNIIIVDNEIIPDAVNKKFSRLDLLLQTPNEQINIEIQVNNYGNFKERALYYWSKIFTMKLNKNDDYSKLQKTISINIIDFNLFENDKPHSSFMVMEKERHEILSDKFRIDFLELKKANKSENKNLKEWLDFLSVTTEEGLDMIEKTTTNPDIICKAVAVVRKMSADEQFLFTVQKREETMLFEEIEKFGTLKK